MSEPWYVKEVKFDKAQGQLDIEIGFKKGSRFEMPDGGLIRPTIRYVGVGSI
jgi:hypothetical protein